MEPPRHQNSGVRMLTETVVQAIKYNILTVHK